jgi:hypothetical protein
MTTLALSGLIVFTSLALALLFSLKAAELAGRAGASPLQNLRGFLDPFMSRGLVLLRHRAARVFSFSARAVLRGAVGFLLSLRTDFKRLLGAIGLFLVRFAKGGSPPRRTRSATSFFLKRVSEHKNGFKGSVGNLSNNYDEDSQ